MHPVLIEIGTNWMTWLALVLIFFAGGLISARFKPATSDASLLGSALGLNVRWGEVNKPWSAAIQQGLVQAAIAGVIGFAIGRVAPNMPGSTGDGIPLHVYGVMMATGFMVGIFISQRQARHERLPPVPLLDAKGRAVKGEDGKPVVLSSAELVGDLTFWLLVSGLVGSRVLYIITRWGDEYARDPSKVFRVWEGGLVWYGGLIAATLTAVWFVKKHRIAFLPYGDILVPAVSLGHGIGRLGCFAAGCCFGNTATTDFPLTVQFPQGSPAFQDHLSRGLIESGALASAPVYPTQIMEALAETLIFFALLRIRARKRFHGQVLLAYFAMYAVWRFINEMFRADDIRAFWFKWPAAAEKPLMMSTSQGIAVIMAVIAAGLLVVLLRKRGKVQEAAPETAQAA